MKHTHLLLVLAVIGSLTACRPVVEGCFPTGKLPSNIEPLTEFGQRAEWSPDNTKIFFLDSAGGDVWQVDVETKDMVRITNPGYRPAGHGYYRVMWLSNGDLLLNCGPERHGTYMQIMDKSLQEAPITLDEEINEGAAVSDFDMKIAWTRRQQKIWTGRIVYNGGIPEITDKRLVVDNDSVVVEGKRYEGILEPQDFRPPEENELIWTQYGRDENGRFTSEVMGYDLITGDLENYSHAPNQYDEPEGISPDGTFTLIECDRHNPMGIGYIDIYKLMLDGEGDDWERLTYFSEVDGYRSSNPVLSDDGRYMAFQGSMTGSEAGAGCGIYVMDLQERAQ